MPVFDITTEEEFTEKVLKSTKPVMVDFWANFPTYTMVAPDVERLAALFEGKCVVCKINVDELPQITECYDLLSIPTAIAFKDGKEVCRVQGFRTVTDMEKIIAKAMD